MLARNVPGNRSRSERRLCQRRHTRARCPIAFANGTDKSGPFLKPVYAFIRLPCCLHLHCRYRGTAVPKGTAMSGWRTSLLLQQALSVAIGARRRRPFGVALLPAAAGEAHFPAKPAARASMLNVWAQFPNPFGAQREAT